MIDKLWEEIKSLRNRYSGAPTIGTWELSFAEEYPCDIFSKENLEILKQLDFVTVSYASEETFINTDLFKISKKELEGEINAAN